MCKKVDFATMCIQENQCPFTDDEIEEILKRQEEEGLKRKQELEDYLEYLAEKQADPKYREELERKLAEEIFEAKEAEEAWIKEMTDATHVYLMYDYQKFK